MPTWLGIIVYFGGTAAGYFILFMIQDALHALKLRRIARELRCGR